MPIPSTIPQQKSLLLQISIHSSVLTTYQREVGSLAWTMVDVSASQVITFHSEPQWIAHLEASKASTKLMVVDFTATWCGPCRWMEPAVNELAEKFPDVEFIKVDVDELENVAEQFGVEAMPTFFFVRNGAVVDRIVGAKKSELQKKVVLHRNYLINN